MPTGIDVRGGSESARAAGITADLSSRTVLVTGASSGLGAHFADLLAGAGASVALAARRIDRLEAAVERIRSAGGRAAALVVDVADERSVVGGFDAAGAALGPIDTVVECAGISTASPAVGTRREEFRA